MQGFWPDAANPGKLLDPKVAGWEGVGGVVIEGLTSIGDWFMEYLADRGAKGENMGGLGKAAASPEILTEGVGTPDEIKVGGNSQTHYNVVQNELHRLVKDSSRFLPVRKLLWTSLEMKGVDKDTGMPVYGPMLVGKAKVASSPAWFGNYLSLDVCTDAGQKQGQHQMYCKPWMETVLGMKISHPNGMRLPMVGGKAIGAEKFTNPCEADLYRFYKTLDECHAEAKRLLVASTGPAVVASGGGK